MTRRGVLKGGATLLAASGSSLLVSPSVSADVAPKVTINKELLDKQTKLNGKIVYEFVNEAHFNLEKVKSMLKGESALVNATVDWGGGDFESAIGAASHMGRRDIALHLLEHGARPDIFTLVMLGKISQVKPVLDAMPHLVTTPGPHGLTLLFHAEKGGKEATEVARYIQTVVKKYSLRT